MTWASYGTTARTLARVPSAVADATLQVWFSAAVEQADLYLGEDFETLPVTVALGVYKYIEALYLMWGMRPGVVSVKTGDLQENFSSSGAAYEDPPLAAALPHWRRLKASLLGDGK